MTEAMIKVIMYSLFLFILSEVLFGMWGSHFKKKLPKRGSVITSAAISDFSFDKNEHLARIIDHYLFTGHYVALDTSYLIKHYETIFNNLDHINHSDYGKIIVAQGTIDRLDSLTNTQIGPLSKYIIEQVYSVRNRVPHKFEIVQMDENQIDAMSIDRNSKDEMELAGIVMVSKYRLSNVVLFTENNENKILGKKLGLQVYPIHKLRS